MVHERKPKSLISSKRKREKKTKHRTTKLYLVDARESYRADILEQMYVGSIAMDEKREKKIGDYIR